MKISINKCIGIGIPISILIYNLNWKIGAFFVLIISILIILGNQAKIKRKPDRLSVLWCVFFFVFAIVSQVIRSYELTVAYVVGYVLVCIILVFGLNEISIKYIFKSFKIIALIEAISIYCQLLIPNVYYRIMSFFVESATIQSISSRVSEGYYTGFTREVSLTVSFLIIAAGMLCIQLMFENNISINKRRVIFIQIIIIFGAMLVSGKRAQPLFFVISLLITYLLYSEKRMKVLKIIGVIIGISLLVVIFFPYIQAIPGISRIVALIQALNSNADVAILTTGRSTIYEAAINLWKKNPFIGIGWNNFKNSFSSNYWYSRFDVHNCYLQILCECGYVGAIYYYYLVIRTLISFYRVTKKEKSVIIKNKPVIPFTVLFFVFFLLYSITGTCLYELCYYLPTFVFFAILQQYNKVDNKICY